jgi:GNAT superfamily N-acetyltransferase
VPEAVAPAATSEQDGLTLRRFEPGDEAGLVALFVDEFGARTRDEWQWALRDGPDGPADIRVLLDGDEIVGSLGHVPFGVWVGGRRLRLAFGCDLIVAPTHRGRGASRLLLEDFRRSEHGFDVNIATVNEASIHATGRYLGSTHLGVVPTWQRFHRRAATRGRAIGWAASAAERARGAAASWPAPRRPVVELERPGAEVDALAEDSRRFAHCIRIRDAAAARWRLGRPGGTTRMRAVPGAGDAIDGYALISTSGQGDERVGAIIDLLARDEHATRALVRDAWEQLVADGCSSVTCWYLDPRPWSERAMRRSGFRRTGGWNVACGTLSEAAGTEVARLDSWFLTRADTEL